MTPDWKKYCADLVCLVEYIMENERIEDLDEDHPYFDEIKAALNYDKKEGKG